MKFKERFGFAAKSAAVVVVVAAVATTGFEIKDSKATLTAPNGKCGYVINANPAGFNLYTSTSPKIVTTIGIMDFDAGTSKYVATKVTNWGTDEAFLSSAQVEEKFTLTAGPNSGQWIATIQNESNTKWNLMSSNSGNTYLIQMAADATNKGVGYVGVCQAL